MRCRILTVVMMCLTISCYASDHEPDLLISGRVLRGNCVSNACTAKSYLIEASDVVKKPVGLSDAMIGVVSACGPQSLVLGKLYSFALSIHDLSVTVLEQNSHGDPEAQDAQLMRLCQFTLVDAH
jgi:hypothetical protein